MVGFAFIAMRSPVDLLLASPGPRRAVQSQLYGAGSIAILERKASEIDTDINVI
jgi:hypothetical protein